MSKIPTADPPTRTAPSHPARLLIITLISAAVSAACAAASFPAPACIVAFVAALMVGLWITEIIPMGATALVPLVALPLLDILPPSKTAQLYADPNVFLFLGGFLIAIAMEGQGLHRRIALGIIRAVGVGPGRILAGFVLAAGVVSMWISNTATTLMMFPIALAVIGRMDEVLEGEARARFATALLLAISYASSIGGIATLVGSPPNMILAGQAKTLLPDLPEITFVAWLRVMLPLSLGLLAVAWGVLAVFARGGRSAPRAAAVAGLTEDLPRRWSTGEVRVAVVFVLTVLGWVLREPLGVGHLRLPGWADALGLEKSHDAMVSIAAALMLFMLGDGKGGRLLDERAFRRVPWEVLLLFGGGFALAEAVQSSGLADRVVSGAAALRGLEPWVLVLTVCLLSTFASELMSNTAQVTLMLPLLAAASASADVHPYLLMVPATLSASLAFMMPVGTPPNAIVFASGRLKLADMARVGLVLNLIGALWITAGFVLFGMRAMSGTGP